MLCIITRADSDLAINHSSIPCSQHMVATPFLSRPFPLLKHQDHLHQPIKLPSPSLNRSELHNRSLSIHTTHHSLHYPHFSFHSSSWIPRPLLQQARPLHPLPLRPHLPLISFGLPTKSRRSQRSLAELKKYHGKLQSLHSTSRELSHDRNQSLDPVKTYSSRPAGTLVLLNFTEPQEDSVTAPTA